LAIVTLPSHGCGREAGSLATRHVCHPTDRAGGWARWRSSGAVPTDRAGGWGPLAIVTLPSHGSGGRLGPLAIVRLPSHGSGGRLGPLAIVTFPSRIGREAGSVGDRHIAIPRIGREAGSVGDSHVPIPRIGREAGSVGDRHVAVPRIGREAGSVGYVHGICQQHLTVNRRTRALDGVQRAGKRETTQKRRRKSTCYRVIDSLRSSSTDFLNPSRVRH